MVEVQTYIATKSSAPAWPSDFVKVSDTNSLKRRLEEEHIDTLTGMVDIRFQNESLIPRHEMPVVLFWEDLLEGMREYLFEDKSRVLLRNTSFCIILDDGSATDKVNYLLLDTEKNTPVINLELPETLFFRDILQHAARIFEFLNEFYRAKDRNTYARVFAQWTLCSSLADELELDGDSMMYLKFE